MNGQVVLRIVDEMHREKAIPRESIFRGIEEALQQAIERKLNAGSEEEIEVTVSLDRTSGAISARRGETEMPPAEVEGIISQMGRIIAQSVKQMMIQKIREVESDTVFTDYQRKRGEMVHGTVQRVDPNTNTAIVSLGKSESLLPRSEQIPGESFHPNERVKAVVLEVRKAGNRVKIILSRCHPDFVRSLFETEIPEIAERIIEIRAVAREAGYRSKVAVSSIDSKVDCVGACVGVRGSRIKNIIDELGGERIDIVRWNDSLQVLIPNALQPASIEEVFLYPRLGRAIVLVPEDQLSLAIGRRGQNVRLASKLVGWDIEIMTAEEYSDGLTRAETRFSRIPGVTQELIERLIEEGCLSFTDVTFLEPEELQEISGLSEDEVDEILAFAEEISEAGESDEEEVRPARSSESTTSVGVADEAAPVEAEVAVVDGVDTEPSAEGEWAPAPSAVDGEVSTAEGEAPVSEAAAEATEVVGEDVPAEPAAEPVAEAPTEPETATTAAAGEETSRVEG